MFEINRTKQQYHLRAESLITDLPNALLYRELVHLTTGPTIHSPCIWSVICLSTMEAFEHGILVISIKLVSGLVKWYKYILSYIFMYI